MNNKVDVKSALIGLCIGVGAMLVIAAKPINPAHHGRYQVHGTGGAAIILDTATGEAWKTYIPPNSANPDLKFFQEK